MPLFFVNAVNSSEAAVLGNTFRSLADMKNERNLNFLPRHVQRAIIIQKLLDEGGKCQVQQVNLLMKKDIRLAETSDASIEF